MWGNHVLHFYNKSQQWRNHVNDSLVTKLKRLAKEFCTRHKTGSQQGLCVCSYSKRSNLCCLTWLGEGINVNLLGSKRAPKLLLAAISHLHLNDRRFRLAGPDQLQLLICWLPCHHASPWFSMSQHESASEYGPMVRDFERMLSIWSWPTCGLHQRTAVAGDDAPVCSR